MDEIHLRRKVIVYHNDHGRERLTEGYSAVVNLPSLGYHREVDIVSMARTQRVDGAARLWLVGDLADIVTEIVFKEDAGVETDVAGSLPPTRSALEQCRLIDQEGIPYNVLDFYPSRRVARAIRDQFMLRVLDVNGMLDRPFLVSGKNATDYTLEIATIFLAKQRGMIEPQEGLILRSTY